LAANGFGNEGGDLHDWLVFHVSNTNRSLEQVVRLRLKMASDVSRGRRESEFDDMGSGRADDQATSRGEIHDRDAPGLRLGELSHERTSTLTTLDQTERIQILQSCPDRDARDTKKPREIILAGQRFARRVAALGNPVLQDQEDLVMERNV